MPTQASGETTHWLMAFQLAGRLRFRPDEFPPPDQPVKLGTLVIGSAGPDRLSGETTGVGGGVGTAAGVTVKEAGT